MSKSNEAKIYEHALAIAEERGYYGKEAEAFAILVLEKIVKLSLEENNDGKI